MFEGLNKSFILDPVSTHYSFYKGFTISFFSSSSESYSLEYDFESFCLCLSSGSSWLKARYLKFEKAIITTVMLSKVRFAIEAFKTRSTILPHYLWQFVALSLLTENQAQLMHSRFDILSKIPSHPKRMKSWFS